MVQRAHFGLATAVGARDIGKLDQRRNCGSHLSPLCSDPDDAKFMSEVAGTKIDEAFIGSCMTNIGHFRAASKLLEGKRDIPVKLWLAPPTKMDAQQLTQEGHYGVFGAAGARTEMPGCSLFRKLNGNFI